jgi:hypothetical protein
MRYAAESPVDGRDGGGAAAVAAAAGHAGRIVAWMPDAGGAPAQWRLRYDNADVGEEDLAEDEWVSARTPEYTADSAFTVAEWNGEGGRHSGEEREVVDMLSREVNRVRPSAAMRPCSVGEEGFTEVEWGAAVGAVHAPEGRRGRSPRMGILLSGGWRGIGWPMMQRVTKASVLLATLSLSTIYIYIYIYMYVCMHVCI